MNYADIHQTIKSLCPGWILFKNYLAFSAYISDVSFLKIQSESESANLEL